MLLNYTKSFRSDLTLDILLSLLNFKKRDNEKRISLINLFKIQLDKIHYIQSFFLLELFLNPLLIYLGL